MDEKSAALLSTVGGETLLDRRWLSARIAEMSRSWGTSADRVGGTLWWCMAASALVEPTIRARIAGLPEPVPALARLDCVIRHDGGIEEVRIVDGTAGPPAATDTGPVDAAAPARRTRSADAPAVPRSSAGQSDRGHAAEHTDPIDGAAVLRETLAAVIEQVAALSGARVPALWAVVGDTVANRALDAGDPTVGERLAADIGEVVPAPRFVELGGQTFVRRVSCCLVYEVPGCEQCISCPKRPTVEREALLAEYAAGR